MKVLVLNCGSSSIKYKLFDMDHKEVIAQGGIEKIGLKGSFLKLTLPDGEKKILEKDIPEHTVGVEFILNTLISSEYGAIKSLDEINAVGHRMVHGGEKFSESVLLTQEVLDAFTACNDLAPLHNPANLKGVNAVSAILPDVPQIGVFDTAFHQTMPPKAYLYGLPYEAYTEDKIRRYGFHGTSHSYVSKRVAQILGKKPEELKTIVCHLGNGSSICAVNQGKCVDTTMGLTPLAGLIMGTRCGDIDPSILEFYAQKHDLDVYQITEILNKKSGVLGISGVSSDFRDVEEAADAGNERCKYALDAFKYQVAKFIGGYAAAMNGVDVIVFTAGVGENSATTRQGVCDYLGYLGITIDAEANGKRGEEIEITTADSKVKVFVVPTNEELMIARDTVALTK